MINKDSFLLGLSFALLVFIALYHIVKCVKQDRYIEYLEHHIEDLHTFLSSLGVPSDLRNKKKGGK